MSGAPGRNYSLCWAPLAVPAEQRYVVSLPSRVELNGPRPREVKNAYHLPEVQDAKVSVSSSIDMNDSNRYTSD